MAKPSQAVNSPVLLSAALEGLLLQQQRIEEQISLVKAALGQKKGPVATASGAPRKRRVLSAAARKRIADAQKKRWAEFRKKQA